MPRVTRTLGVELYPTARCDGQGCRWTHPESRFTRDNAKAHAKDNPGHLVIVETIKRDAYKLEGS